MKQYVCVTAQFDCEGRIMPMKVHWEDGRTFEIDRITDIRRAASLKAGGAGIRYTCLLLGKQRYLFLEDDRWFVEI